MNSMDYMSTSSFEIVERFLRVTDRLLGFTSVSRIYADNSTCNGVHTQALALLLKAICKDKWED